MTWAIGRLSDKATVRFYCDGPSCEETATRVFKAESPQEDMPGSLEELTDEDLVSVARNMLIEDLGWAEAYGVAHCPRHKLTK